MANRVPLNNIEHQDLRVAVRHSPAPGDTGNQTLVVPNEYEDVQREFPIFIRKDSQGQWVSVALLGFERGENLFLNADQWTSRYVPAIHRRGPFYLAVRQQEQGGEPDLSVHVDLDDARVGDAEGQPLFREHGGSSPYLDHVTNALQTVHQGLGAARAMFEMIDLLGLIQPVEIEVKLGDGTTYQLQDLFTIGMEPFRALRGAQLEQLHSSGFLAPVLFVRSSLPNMNRLIDLKNRKLAGSPAGPA